MRSIEVHLIESTDDVVLGLLAGLLEPKEMTEYLVCPACDEEIGEVSEEEFIEFVVMLDDRRKWFICMECSDDVVNGYQSSNEARHSLFVDDLEDLDYL
jgi:uncharacterized protein with PIN domain